MRQWAKKKKERQERGKAGREDSGIKVVSEGHAFNFFPLLISCYNGPPNRGKAI